LDLGSRNPEIKNKNLKLGLSEEKQLKEKKEI
jgi:hypothetical protein